MTRPKALADSWYADALGLASLQSVGGGPVISRLLRSEVSRGAVLWWYGRRYAAVVIPLAGAAPRTLFLLERLFGRRRRYLVLLEFIPVVGEDSRLEWGGASRIRGKVSSMYWRHIVAPVFRRCLLRAQSLTRWEVDRNGAYFGLEPGRLQFIPYMRSGRRAPADVGVLGAGSGVLSSGRAACDWETVFAAAEGASWPLTVVCSAADLERVNLLNRSGRATVLSEISRNEHARLMREAAVYLLALKEAEVSSGHVRLGDAALAGTAVAASSVRGLEDYFVAGKTALVFDPGDAGAARATVNRLIDDPVERAAVAQAAVDYSLEWTRSDYVKAVSELVAEALDSLSCRQPG